jgi:hypothetical protein
MASSWGQRGQINHRGLSDEITFTEDVATDPGDQVFWPEELFHNLWFCCPLLVQFLRLLAEFFQVVQFLGERRVAIGNDASVGTKQHIEFVL